MRMIFVFFYRIAVVINIFTYFSPKYELVLQVTRGFVLEKKSSHRRNTSHGSESSKFSSGRARPPDHLKTPQSYMMKVHPLVEKMPKPFEKNNV